MCIRDSVSGWRSHAEQQALYADSVRDNGLEFTQKYVALPGCSEHCLLYTSRTTYQKKLMFSAEINAILL